MTCEHCTVVCRIMGGKMNFSNQSAFSNKVFADEV